MKINGNTNIYAVIGHPIAHTLSPILHNAAFEKLDLNAIYVAFDVQSNNLEKVVDGFKSLGIRGFNVTIPHKATIIPFLNTIDPLAEKISAVNTVKNINGELKGFNTDGEGLLQAFKQENIPVEGCKIIVIGAGGAAKAISFALASSARELVIINRTKKNAKQLTKSLSKHFSCSIKSRILTHQNIFEELKNAQILINATPIGMHPNINLTVIPREFMTKELTVADIIYNPVKTRLLKDAESRGAKILNGLSMLVYQAVRSFEIWTGIKINANILFKAIKKEL